MIPIKPLAVVACLALLAVSSVGCTPAPTSPPSPTVVATGPSETTPDTDALYAEAETVYRRFFELDVALQKSGEEPSPEVLALVGGPFGDTFRDTKERQHDLGITYTGTIRMAYLTRAPGRAAADTTLALASCTVFDHIIAHQDDKDTPLNGVTKAIYSFRQQDGVMRIWYQETEEGESC